MKNRARLLLGIVFIVCSLILLSCDDNSTKPRKVANPVFSLSSGIYNSFLEIELTCATDDAKIYYTSDGREPTETSDLYTEAINITSNKTIRAKAFRDNYKPSSIVIAEYQLVLPTVAQPTFTPNPGTYNFPQKITINCATDEAEIYFTLDGSQPTTYSELFTDSISVVTTTIVTAKAFKSGFNASSITIVEYIIDSLTVASPSFSPEPGIYNEEQFITISCPTPGADIHYTINGRIPTITSPLYDSPLEISSTSTIKAIALKNDYLPSEMITGLFEIDYISVAVPIFSPIPGNYKTSQMITLNSSTPGANIYYTLDGSNPSEESLLYDTPFTIHTTTLIKAVGFKDEYLPSVITSARYIIEYLQVATPVFSPLPGDYLDQQTITLTSATPGTTIYYTLGGGEPTESSQLYHTPFTITQTNVILRARGYKNDLLASEIATGEFNIFYQVVSTPTFSPDPGSYPDEQIVTIECSTPNTTIYYTLNNSQPTELSQIYTEPLNISSATLIKARAFNNDYYPSNIAQGYYTIGYSIPLNFVFVEGGTFNNETSDITISNFYMCEREVTQYEYVYIMGNNPSGLVGMTNPVENLTWFNAIAYCNLRSIAEGIPPCYTYNNEGTNPNDWSSGWDSDANHENFSCDFTAPGYRLPTEMEWMYVAKGGNQSPASGYNQWSGTDVLSELTNYAWYLENTEGEGPRPVRTKAPNQLNFWDMSGNVYEWCWDILGDYSNDPQTNPIGATTGTERIVRGGSCSSSATNCTVHNRAHANPTGDYNDVGFRTVRSAE